MKILGFVQAIDGKTLVINTTTDELVQIHVKDRKKRWDLYCKHIKIDVTPLTEEEFHEETQEGGN